ncbi:MAG: hypothetical protein ABIO68_01440 [Sphingomicrobium sp.]
MRKLRQWSAILSLLSVSALAHATQPGWIENGKPAADNAARAANGAFGAMLVVTDDWEGFLKQWEQPMAGFDIPRLATIRKGRPLTSAVIFTGCKADSSGNCSVLGDFRVVDPNGKVYAEQRGANIWRLPPPDPRLQLSVESLGLSLDPPDTLGTYVLTATITDRVANKTLELRTTFEARD